MKVKVAVLVAASVFSLGFARAQMRDDAQYVKPEYWQCRELGWLIDGPPNTHRGWEKACIPPVPGGRMQRVVVMDVTPPYVLACAPFTAPANGSRSIVCHYTMAGAIVDKSGTKPRMDPLIKSASRKTMVDVKALPEEWIDSPQ